MDDLLVGYALNALSDAEMATVTAYIRTHPADAEKVRRVRKIFAVLEADDEPELPPPGLALAAVIRTAEHIVQHGVPEAETLPTVPRTVPDTRFWSARYVEIAIVASIAFLFFGFVATAVSKVRFESQVAACKNNLQTLYASLSRYSEVRDGHFPKAGTPELPRAGGFVAALAEAGQLSSAKLAVCPTDTDATSPVSYAYTLGYRNPTGQLMGLKKCSNAEDLTPVSADVATAHGRGQNILFAGGFVQFSTKTTVGPNNDDIYCNDDHRNRAGLHRFDASLGRGDDMP